MNLPFHAKYLKAAAAAVTLRRRQRRFSACAALPQQCDLKKEEETRLRLRLLLLLLGRFVYFVFAFLRSFVGRSLKPVGTESKSAIIIVVVVLWPVLAFSICLCTSHGYSHTAAKQSKAELA